MTSTIERGNEFRDIVCQLLVAAGFRNVSAEVRQTFKKVDARSEWTRDSMFGRKRILVEAKDYAQTLPRQECKSFIEEYGALVRAGTADYAWLVTKGPVSPDSREHIDTSNGDQLRCFTYAELQRHLFQADGYLADLVEHYERERIESYYVPPCTEDGADLETHVRDWVSKNNAAPLVILGSYGKGKSTFALHLAARMAREALSNATSRVPILVPLGEIVDEQSIDGLVGKVLVSQHRVDNYHYHLFRSLNEAGRLVVIFDGLDEMKHGMTFPVFQQNMAKILQLDSGESRILILGRDTVFRDDIEFKAIIEGRRMTAGGQEAPALGRRRLSHVTLRGFTLNEARQFVRRYFPIKADDLSDGSVDRNWVAQRTLELLSGKFDELLVRPVHAQMLCEIAAVPETKLDGLSTYQLYDLFIHYLIEREVIKPGRYAAFDSGIRRKFNAGVAWWLWERGKASTTTFADVPTELCASVVEGTPHEFDEIGLKRELTSGCLVEKGNNTIYFGHRSIQEFLVAEYLFDTELLLRRDSGRGDLTRLWPFLNSVVVEFLIQRVESTTGRQQIASNWLSYLCRWRAKEINRSALALFINLYKLARVDANAAPHDPWFMLLGYLANGADDKLVPSPDATDFALIHLRTIGSLNTSVALGLIHIWSKIILNAGASTRDSAVMFTSYALAPIALASAVSAARSKASVSIRQNQSPALWAILSSLQVQRNDRREVVIELDVARLAKISAPALEGMIEVASVPEEMRVSFPVQTIYQLWSNHGVSARDIDLIRPYFTDQHVRSRIKPLIVSSAAMNDSLRIDERS